MKNLIVTINENTFFIEFSDLNNEKDYQIRQWLKLLK